MKKRYYSLLCAAMASAMLFVGCGGADNQKAAADSLDEQAGAAVTEVTETEEAENTEQAAADKQETALEDGVYTVDFDTDSGMFHVSEACEGKGTLTVTDGEMMLHISLASKNIVNLYQGLAADAEADGAEVLCPTVDTVTYSDGMTEEVHGFDVPVPVLDEEFDLALLGTKGKWYDHKVIVSNPVKADDGGNAADGTGEAAEIDLADGEYTIDVVLEGGSGRATVSSPAALLVKEGRAYARIEWSSPNYDYMKIGNEMFDPVNTEGNSVFELPVSVLDEKMAVVADTVAMGTPHEIEYTLTFYSDSIE